MWCRLTHRKNNEIKLVMEVIITVIAICTKIEYDITNVNL